MDDEEAQLDKMNSATNDEAADRKLQKPQEGEAKASTRKIEGGKDAADKFVDKAKDK